MGSDPGGGSSLFIKEAVVSIAGEETPGPFFEKASRIGADDDVAAITRVPYMQLSIRIIAQEREMENRIRQDVVENQCQRFKTSMV